MTNFFLILIGKLCSFLFRFLNLGNGSTWPGHIALKTNKHFISEILKNSPTQIIVIAGTNGKTTTAKMIRTILEKNGKIVLQNESGANLLNGIASTLILSSNFFGKIKADYLVLEVDENVLPLLLKEITPNYIILLNLFRDQLDRYGEVRAIASKWKAALSVISSDNERSSTSKPALILNADDPEVAWLGMSVISSSLSLRADGPSRNEGSSKIADSSPLVQNDNTFYFGMDDPSLHQKKADHAVDSIYCPNCQTHLTYSTRYYAHLGIWSCPKCRIKRPELTVGKSSFYPLEGIYNKYNFHAVLALMKSIGITENDTKNSLSEFIPAFGRQEKLVYKNKKVQLFLSKNPTSFNESIKTIASLKAKHILIALNDRAADGHDVSWIWDTELEQYLAQFKFITITGDRCYDLGLRLKYANDKFIIQNSDFRIEENIDNAIERAIDQTGNDETLYILPTYTAMLDIRKILTGKKIL